jgi:hypothetical protein
LQQLPLGNAALKSDLDRRLEVPMGGKKAQAAWSSRIWWLNDRICPAFAILACTLVVATQFGARSRNSRRMEMPI